jgi:hypothetical protein
MKMMSPGEGGRKMMNREEGRSSQSMMTVLHVMIVWMLVIGKGGNIHNLVSTMFIKSMTIQSQESKELMCTTMEMPFLSTVLVLNKAQNIDRIANRAETMVLYSTAEGVVSTICQKRRGKLGCDKCRLTLRSMKSRDGRG